MSAVPTLSRAGRARLADVVLLLLRLGLAAVFIRAAIPKIVAPDLFALAILNYRMLPAWGVDALALVLPWVELFAGIGLALGVWRRACALVMAALMTVFMIAYATARARGLDIACGCFEVGQEAAPASTLWIVARDLAFLAMALVLVRYHGGTRPLAWFAHRKRAQA